MTIDINNLIDKYIIGKLKGKKLNDFLEKLKGSPELAFEVQFATDMSQAIRENDVMDLRSNLQSILTPNSNKSNKSFFELAENLDQASITNSEDEENFDPESSLQYIHLENHKKSRTEKVHQIPSENDKINMTKDLDDNELWKEVSAAVQEKDIIELRANVQQITAEGSSEITDLDIDRFLDKDLPDDLMEELNVRARKDKNLKKQIRLHKEIDEAVSEYDVASLRDQLGEIIDEEQMMNFSEIKRIDEYLMSYLDNMEEDEFNDSLMEDDRLKQETALNKEINEAITETDVMNLRSSIGSIINEEKDDVKVRKFIPDHIRKHPSRLIGAAASVAAVISVGAMTMSQNNKTAEDIYREAYRPYEATGLYRSNSSAHAEILGVDLYNEQQYTNALTKFNQVLHKNPEHPMCNFYTGLCYQELEKYSEAITAFQKVIDEKDNLFIEQAEWYQALSMINTVDKAEAYESFTKIVNKKGYYSKEAKDILKKIE